MVEKIRNIPIKAKTKIKHYQWVRVDSLMGNVAVMQPFGCQGEKQGMGDRIVTLQRIIDDGRSSGRLPLTEGREYQTRLDSIRRDYLRMTEGGRYTTNEERADISRRLDSLETDLNRFQ